MDRLTQEEMAEAEFMRIMPPAVCKRIAENIIDCHLPSAPSYRQPGGDYRLQRLRDLRAAIICDLGVAFACGYGVGTRAK
jgi:hypothetical protein